MKSRIVQYRKSMQPKSIVNRTRKEPVSAPATMKEVEGQPTREVHRRVRFDLKPAHTVKPHRRGTARAMVVGLLGKG